jgi:hypothetical protein
MCHCFLLELDLLRSKQALNRQAPATHGTVSTGRPLIFNAFVMPNQQEEALSGRQWLGWGMFALLLASYSLKTVVRNRDWANGMQRRT